MFFTQTFQQFDKLRWKPICEFMKQKNLKLTRNFSLKNIKLNEFR